MAYKSVVAVFIMLFLLIGLLSEVDASSVRSVSLDSVGVTVDLVFPEEAHPTDTITHNLTITAHKSLTLNNFTLIINAFVDTALQQIYKGYISQVMIEDENITMKILLTLPQKTHERLYCFIYISTSLLSDAATYTFYTTYVRTLTYDELLADFNELLTNYSSLLSQYQTLLQSYNNLSAQYNALNSAYNLLLNQYTALQANYNTLNSTYHSLQGNYSALSADYDSLETTYNSLNQTYTFLQTEVNNLHQRENALTAELNNTRNAMYVFIASTIALIVLILYIKKKKPEPYIVLRKETVALKPEQQQ